jgi:hydrogenase maturation factor
VSAGEPDTPLAGTPAGRDDAGAIPCVAPAGRGVPMRVLARDPRGGSRARCAAVDGIPATVETALVGSVEPGEIVLVHAGVALLRLDAEWAP